MANNNNSRNYFFFGRLSTVIFPIYKSKTKLNTVFAFVCLYPVISRNVFIYTYKLVFHGCHSLIETDCSSLIYRLLTIPMSSNAVVAEGTRNTV